MAKQIAKLEKRQAKTIALNKTICLAIQFFLVKYKFSLIIVI